MNTFRLLKKKLSPKTINNILLVLSSMLCFAVKNRVIDRVDGDFFIKSESAELIAVRSGNTIVGVMLLAFDRNEANRQGAPCIRSGL